MENSFSFNESRGTIESARLPKFNIYTKISDIEKEDRLKGCYELSYGDPEESLRLDSKDPRNENLQHLGTIETVKLFGKDKNEGKNFYTMEVEIPEVTVRKLLDESCKDLFQSVGERYVDDKIVEAKFKKVEDYIKDLISNIQYVDPLLLYKKEETPTLEGEAINRLALALCFYKEYKKYIPKDNEAKDFEYIDLDGADMNGFALGFLYGDIAKKNPLPKGERIPQRGIVLLQKFNRSNNLMQDIVLGNQERLDGSGEPYAKKGAKIDFVNRLAGIIYTVEGLTKSMTLNKALHSLLQNSGYDQKVLNILIKALISKTEVR